MRKKILLVLMMVLALAGIVYAAGFDGNNLFFRNSSGVDYKVTPPDATTTMVGTDTTQTLTNKTLTAPTFNTGTWNTATLNDPAIRRGSWNTGTLNTPTINTPIMNRGTWATGTSNDPVINRGTWNTGTANAPTVNTPVITQGSWATASLTSPTMTGTVTVPDASFTRAKLSGAAERKSLVVLSATIMTAATTDIYIIVPETGTLDSVDFSGTDTLAVSDTNYLTFSITNMGTSGGGSTVMLGAVDANTTKTTGGSAITANAKRSLTLHTTVADLGVTAGERLLLRVTQTGTIANSVTYPAWLLRFTGTT